MSITFFLAYTTVCRGAYCTGVCVGVAGRLDEIIGNRNLHTHTLSHTHRCRRSFRAGGGTAVSQQQFWNGLWPPPHTPNNPVNNITMVKKITNGLVYLQRALIIFANSDSSREPVYKTAQPSLLAHTIYDKDQEIQSQFMAAHVRLITNSTRRLGPFRIKGWKLWLSFLMNGNNTTPFSLCSFYLYQWITSSG